MGFFGGSKTKGEDLQTINRLEIGKRGKDELSLVDLISAYSYDEATDMYVLADGSLSVIFESDLITASALDGNQLYKMSNDIAMALSAGTRVNITGQMIVLQTKDLSAELQEYQRYGGTINPILSNGERLKVEHTKQLLTDAPFEQGTGGGAPFHSKRIKVFWTLTLRPDEKVGGVFKSLIDSITSTVGGNDENGLDPEGKRFYRYREKMTDILDKSRRRIVNTVSRFTTVSAVPPDRLLYVYRSMLYPETGGLMKHIWDVQVPLNKQIPMRNIQVIPDEGTMISEGHFHKMLSLSEIPDYSMVGMCSLPNPNLGWLTLFDYLSNGWMVINFEALAQNYMRHFLEKRKRFAEGGMAMPSKIPYLVADCDLAAQYVEVEKRRFYKVSMSVCLHDTDLKNLNKECESLRDKFQEMGLEARIEDSVGPSILIQDLPFNYGPSLDEMRRTFLMPDRALSDMLALYGNGRGFPAAKNGIPFLLYNRSGEPFGIDTFQCTNPHSLIAGGSGSGKSVFTQGYLGDFLRQNSATAFVIDKGRSYAAFTSMLGADGSYNNLGLSQKTCINGFAGTYEMCSAFLKRLLSHLACPTGNASDMLTGEELGKIETCLEKAFRQKRQDKTYHHYEELHSTDIRIKTWVHEARKRFEIQALDELTLSNVLQLKATEHGRTPVFDIYGICYINSRQIFDERERKTVSESFTSLDGISDRSLKYLEGRSVRVEEDVDGKGNKRVIGLFSNPASIRAMENDGFTVDVVNNVQLVEVGHPDDFKQLEMAGVTFLVTDEFYDQKLQELYQSIRANPRFANADEVTAMDLAQEQMNDIDGLDYFTYMQGKAVIQNEVFFSDLIEVMKNQDDSALDAVIARFAPYYGEGAFAGFFDGSTGFELAGKKLITFELHELASAGEHLLSAVMSLLLQMIILHSQESDNAMHRKWLVIDEAWELMASEAVSKSLVNLYRTARKHNLACSLISQSMLDFAKTEDGRAIMNNAATRLILRQTPEAIQQFDDILNMSERQIALMETVNTVSGYFSEVFVQATELNINEVARLIPNPYFYWLATTNADDKALREKTRKTIKAETGDDDTKCLDRACRLLAEQYPKGSQNGKVG